MKPLKVVALLIGVLAISLIAGGIYVKTALPNTGPAPDIKVERTAERIANGRYLANHVTICMNCHSQRDTTLFAGPITDKGIGAGGEAFDQARGFPGAFFAANITPAALGSWTDGEIFRAVTSGVSKDGRALFPIMGWDRFGKMDKADIYDIIAYIRTLKPVEKHIRKSKADFPVNFLINLMPRKADLKTKPNPSDTLRYGGYLVNAAGCIACHSKEEKGEVIQGTEFGGGREFKMAGGTVRSRNITAEKATGIGSWTKDMFVKRFKFYATLNYTAPRIGKNQMNTPMPWAMFGGMKERDLESIYCYLRQVKPIKNKVIVFTPAER